MKQYEFQFVFKSEEHSFGFDVYASTIKEAVEKANNFFDSVQTLPCSHNDVERVWLNGVVTEESIGGIFDPESCSFISIEDFEQVCSLCNKAITNPDDAHLHQGKYIGECCWDERLKASE